MLTTKIFKQAFPNCKSPDEWVEIFNQLLPVFNVTESTVACFLAQCAHESGQFNILEENLNYSSKALLSVFPKYFNEEQAVKFQRKPEVIGSIVYANRMGNGDVKSAEGYKFRGRGIIQLTGKDNYRKFSLFAFEDERLLEDPSIVTQKKFAALSAFWFWKTNSLNAVYEKGGLLAVTKRINGGTNGLEDRKKYYEKLKELL